MGLDPGIKLPCSWVRCTGHNGGLGKTSCRGAFGEDRDILLPLLEVGSSYDAGQAVDKWDFKMGYCPQYDHNWIDYKYVTRMADHTKHPG